MVIRRYWQGHESWVIKANFTCAAGHYPTVVLWRGKKPFEPGGHSFMCGVVAGRRNVCRELTVC